MDMLIKPQMEFARRCSQEGTFLSYVANWLVVECHDSMQEDARGKLGFSSAEYYSTIEGLVRSPGTLLGQQRCQKEEKFPSCVPTSVHCFIFNKMMMMMIFQSEQSRRENKQNEHLKTIQKRKDSCHRKFNQTIY